MNRINSGIKAASDKSDGALCILRLFGAPGHGARCLDGSKEQGCSSSNHGNVLNGLCDGRKKA